MARTTDRPRGARLPGLIAIEAASTCRQPPGRRVWEGVARPPDGPRGAGLRGLTAIEAASTSRQPAVIRSSAALDNAGVELAPVSATPPAAWAEGSSAGNPATKSRASA